MQVYELGYLVLPSISEDGLADITGKIKDLVAKEGGSIFAGEDPVKIDLAYTMVKTIGASRYVVNDAYIGWIKFESEPDTISAIRDDVKKMNEVLRSLVIKAPRESAFTFAQARQKLEKKEEEVIAPTLDNDI